MYATMKLCKKNQLHVSDYHGTPFSHTHTQIHSYSHTIKCVHTHTHTHTHAQTEPTFSLSMSANCFKYLLKTSSNEAHNLK